MLRRLIKGFKREEAVIPRPIYSLERQNEVLHDMVREIAEQRNEYRIENQRLRDENDMLRRIIERYENGSKERS